MCLPEASSWDPGTGGLSGDRHHRTPSRRASLVGLASIQNWVWNVPEGFIYTSYRFKGPTVISSGKVPARTRKPLGHSWRSSRVRHTRLPGGGQNMGVCVCMHVYACVSKCAHAGVHTCASVHVCVWCWEALPDIKAYFEACVYVCVHVCVGGSGKPYQILKPTLKSLQ